MRVGVVGGHSIFGIGTKEEMQIFFEAIRKYVQIHDPYTDYDVILDRLYKRYLRLEDLKKAAALLNRINDAFYKIIIPDEYIDFALRNERITSFKIKSNNLAEFFASYIKTIQAAIDSAIHCYESSKADGEALYQKVMICHSDVVPSTIDEMRPNEMYDNLEGDPYWMRESKVDWDTSKK